MNKKKSNINGWVLRCFICTVKALEYVLSSIFDVPYTYVGHLPPKLVVKNSGGFKNRKDGAITEGRLLCLCCSYILDSRLRLGLWSWIWFELWLLT